jgi:hypothetical protein
MSALIKNRYDLIVIQWTYLNRLNFNVGLETYPVDTRLTDDLDINIVNHVTISAKWLQDLGDRLRMISNIHWDILKLVKYVNTLREIQCHSRKQELLFVNGAVVWPDQYFCKKDYTFPNELSDFEQRMLDTEHRDDEEIKKIYHMCHDSYTDYGGIQEKLWANLYDPMIRTKIDNIRPGDFHPGYQSQALFADQFKLILQNRNIL